MRPLTPTVSPGAVVATPAPPQDERTMSIETQIQIQKGNKIEIGSLISNLNANSHKVSVSAEVAGQSEIHDRQQ